MTKEQLILISQRLNKYLTSRDAAVANGYLEKIKEENVQTLYSIKFRSPMTGLILGWFLGAFGGGAFYAKRTGYGIIQLIATLLYFFSAFPAILLMEDGDFGFLAVLMGVAALTMWTLYIIGLACVWKWVKKYNFQKLMEVLPLL